MRARKSAPSSSARAASGTAASDSRWRRRARRDLRRRRRARRRAAPPLSTSRARPRDAVRISTPRARASRRHRLRDRAHAADGVAPRAALAVHLAEHVMQQHVRGSRAYTGSAKLPTTASKPNAALIGADSNQRSSMSPALLVKRSSTSRSRGEVERCASRLPAFHAAQRVARRRRRRWAAFRAAARAARRRRARASRSTAGSALGVALREARDLALRRRQPAADLEMPPSGSGRKLANGRSTIRKPVLGEPQIADHLRVQQAHGVARGRVAKAGMEFLGHRGAADDAAPLEHAHLQARRREIARAGEAVVARADDDGVVFLRFGHLMDDTGERVAGDIRAAFPALITAMVKQEQSPPPGV